MFRQFKITILLMLSLCTFAAFSNGQGKRSPVKKPVQVEDAEMKELKRKKAELEIALKKQELRKQIEEMERKLAEKPPTEESPPDQITNVTPVKPKDDNVTEEANNSKPVPITKKEEQAPTSSPASESQDSPPPEQEVDCNSRLLNQTSSTRLDESICKLINKIVKNKVGVQDENVIKSGIMGQQIVEILAAKLAPNEISRSFFLDSQKKRLDKQVGASGNSAGNTSLTVKGGAPAIIGWAVEQGAATSDVTGNTVTVRVNPFNLGKALIASQGIVELSRPNNNLFDSFLRKLTVGVSFDITRGTNPPVFIGSKQQISAFTARYEFINHRNPLRNEYKTQRENFFSSQTGNLDGIAAAVLGVVKRADNTFQYPILNRFIDETNIDLANIPKTGLSDVEHRDKVTKVVLAHLAKLPIEELGKIKELTDALKDYTEKTKAFQDDRDKLIEEFNKGAVAAFEYTNNREPIAPDTSNFRFIWEKGVFRKTDFTINASLTMYNKKPVITGVKRIRDFQFALSSETPLGNIFGNGEATLTFAGRFERLNGDTVNALGIVTPNSKGNMAVGQIKLTIPIADWGIKLPLSVTFANRTDLIKENTVRMNFGFTYDLDPLFARFKPF
jgi:hypothetical protein